MFPFIHSLEGDFSCIRIFQDEELKREADAVLAEVTRRQSEGRRQVALLEALQKLHQARLQTSEVRGSRLSTEEKQSAEHSLITIGMLFFSILFWCFLQHTLKPTYQ